ncbi:MAG: hypothetical protein M3350_10185, partial [Actinomycetota bacterium]|nr:hypothetical protein [Actinomycetota bacterium]
MTSRLIRTAGTAGGGQLVHAALPADFAPSVILSTMERGAEHGEAEDQPTAAVPAQRRPALKRPAPEQRPAR